MKPESHTQYDYEYKRIWTRNIFVSVAPLEGKRTINVTKSRKKSDFADYIKELVDIDYPKAKKIQLVLDNLNTHFSSSFYETFSKKEADRILSKIEFYYSPKHGSCLNMAVIEITSWIESAWARSIGEAEKLESEISYWSEKRNLEKKKILWSFTRQDADYKLSKYYVA